MVNRKKEWLQTCEEIKKTEDKNYKKIKILN